MPREGVAGPPARGWWADDGGWPGAREDGWHIPAGPAGREQGQPPARAVHVEGEREGKRCKERENSGFVRDTARGDVCSSSNGLRKVQRGFCVAISAYDQHRCTLNKHFHNIMPEINSLQHDENALHGPCLCVLQKTPHTSQYKGLCGWYMPMRLGDCRD